MPPPQQKPVAPSFFVESSCAFSHFAPFSMSWRSFGWSSFACIARPSSSLPGYPPSGDSPSGASARNPSTAARRATSSMYGFRPRFSWITSTAGHGPLPAGCTR